MAAPPSSDHTNNEISDGAKVGGNAYQAKHMHFGGRSVGLTVVGLAAIGALTYLVVDAHANRGTGKERLSAAASRGPATASATATPSPSPSKPKASPSGPADSGATADSEAEKAPSSPAATKAAPKAATPSTAYTGVHLYCSGWRGSGANLKARACVQITGSDAQFGTVVKNVGRSQAVVGVSLKYLYQGTAHECPQGVYRMPKIRIDPGTSWYSSLGLCSANDLTHGSFQALAQAVEDPDGDAGLESSAPKYSPTAAIGTDGTPQCKSGSSSWGSCDALWPYSP
ncbi:hypothetical protein ACL07V_06810 [Streptomyces sp. MB22_4]|uniref:hypothetical protein n=1 Tax=Streptomyces sp. MB22_4 TaxID=3383120 RepID=UPI0039A0D38D